MQKHEKTTRLPMTLVHFDRGVYRFSLNPSQWFLPLGLRIQHADRLSTIEYLTIGSESFVYGRPLHAHFFEEGLDFPLSPIMPGSGAFLTLTTPSPLHPVPEIFLSGTYLSSDDPLIQRYLQPVGSGMYSVGRSMDVHHEPTRYLACPTFEIKPESTDYAVIETHLPFQPHKLMVEDPEGLTVDTVQISGQDKSLSDPQHLPPFMPGAVQRLVVHNHTSFTRTVRIMFQGIIANLADPEPPV